MITRLLAHFTPTCSHGTRLHSICGRCIAAISAAAKS